MLLSIKLFDIDLFCRSRLHFKLLNVSTFLLLLMYVFFSMVENLLENTEGVVSLLLTRHALRIVVNLLEG